MRVGCSWKLKTLFGLTTLDDLVTAIQYRNDRYQAETQQYIKRLAPTINAIHTFLDRQSESIRWGDMVVSDSDITLIGHLQDDEDDYIALFGGRRVLVELPFTIIDESQPTIVSYLEQLYGPRVNEIKKKAAQSKLVELDADGLAELIQDIFPESLSDEWIEELDAEAEEPNNEDQVLH